MLGAVDSTNAELMRRAERGAPEGTVVIAERQLEGRGRLGRQWLDRPGSSLLCSVLFRPAFSASGWHLAGTALSLAALSASRQLSGAELSIKWPNDIVDAAAAKVAGLLSESGPAGALVVGVGINCNWTENLPPGATSLALLAGHSVDRRLLADELLSGLERRWSALLPEAELGGALTREAGRLMEEYRQSCATLGRLVRVQLKESEVVGRAVAIDDAGRLVVESADGRIAVATGDVVHLRPNRPSPPA